MSGAQNSLAAVYEEPVPNELPGDDAFGLSPDGKSDGECGIEGDADLGGHTLLARRPAPQGRRSLFRR
jgi:hypothetical protein